MRWFTILCAVVLMPASAPVAATDYAKPCFSAKSNPKSAFAACSHLIASGRFKGRNLANVYDWRSLAAYRSHNWSSAIANINRALRLGSTNRSNLLFRRATAFAATGNLEEALKSAEQSTHANSRSTDAYLVLAQVLARMRDYDRAINAADRAVALNPNSAVAYNQRGFLHHMRKDAS